MQATVGSLPTALPTHGLLTRPSRPPNYSDDARRLSAIIREIPNSPTAVLARAAAEALLFCGAHSAGIDLLAESQTVEDIGRPAIVGPLAVSMDSGVARRFSPSRIIVDQSAPLLLRPGRYFPSLADWQPTVVEMLLVPFEIADHARGAIWVVSHDDTRTFDTEDQRRLTNLAQCASACYQLAVTLTDLTDEISASRTLATRLLGLKATLETSGAERPVRLSAHQRALSGREEQVCRLVALGHTNTVIAASLHVNEKTVGTYRSRVADKLGFRTRADYVTYAVERGWLQSV